MGSWLDTSYQGELLTGYWFKVCFTATS
jgi:hypothetical protein